MSFFIRAAGVIAGVLALQGCEPSPPPPPKETTLQKQVKTCIADVKLGLGDPNSLELLNTEEIVVDGGGHRVKLQYTAKNAMGGRVRGEDICGFKDKNSVDLYTEDRMNQVRKMARQLNELGIRIK